MSKKILTPAAYATNNIQSQPDQVKGQASALKLSFDQTGIDAKSYTNTSLIAEIQSETPNDAGANSVGAEGTFGTNNVGDELKAVKVITDDLDTKDTNNVKLTGNQSVDGVKTFTSSPIVPTPTTDSQAVTKKYVDDLAPLNIPDNSLTETKMAADMKKQAGGVATYEMGLTPKQLGGAELINGGFSVNQRGVSGTVTLSAGVYGHDRWKAGSGGCTYTFSEINGIVTLNISSGSLVQEILGTNLQSDDYTLSWGGTSQGRVDLNAFGDSPITESATSGVNLIVEFNTGTLFNAKLEIGDKANAFISKKYKDEFEDCSWYLLDLFGRHTLGFYTPNYIVFLTSALSTKMRVTPTLFINGAVTGTDYDVVVSDGNVSSGFMLSSLDSNGSLRLDKTSHGVTDAFVWIKTTKKVFADAEI